MVIVHSDERKSANDAYPQRVAESHFPIFIEPEQYEGRKNMEMYACYYNMDTGCVDAWLKAGHILSIDCTKVEQVEAENIYQRSELDYLISNNPAAYAELIVEGDPKRYLQTVTRYALPEEMK